MLGFGVAIVFELLRLPAGIVTAKLAEGDIS